MKSYELGVLGGMGALATIIFFERLVSRTQATCDQEHINAVILNHVSMPDRTKVIEEGNDETMLDYFRRDLLLLESIGVHHIAIPCNTSHVFFDQLQGMTSVPLIHMIKEAAIWTAKKYRSALIMGTDGTIRGGLYQRFLTDEGVRAVVPNLEDQQQIMHWIYGVKAGETVDAGLFDQTIEKWKLKYEVSAVILACTELSTIPYRANFVVDAMDALVYRSIVVSGKQMRRTA